MSSIYEWGRMVDEEWINERGVEWQNINVNTQFEEIVLLMVKDFNFLDEIEVTSGSFLTLFGRDEEPLK